MILPSPLFFQHSMMAYTQLCTHEERKYNPATRNIEPFGKLDWKCWLSFNTLNWGWRIWLTSAIMKLAQLHALPVFVVSWQMAHEIMAYHFLASDQCIRIGCQVNAFFRGLRIGLGKQYSRLNTRIQTVVCRWFCTTDCVRTRRKIIWLTARC